MKRSTLENKTQPMSLERLIYTLPGNLYWKDVHGVFMGCNKEQAINLGFKDVKEIVGKTNADLGSKEEADKVTATDIEVIRNGAEICLEEPPGKDGQWYLSKKIPLKNDEGQVIGLLGVSMNITKQKNLEKKLIEQNGELTEALELKERVLRNVSHEIRTPLTGMHGLAEGTLDLWDKLPDEEKRENLAHIVKRQNELIELVLNMLDISKLKSGTEELAIENNDITKLARDIIDEFAVSRKVSLDVEPNADTVVRCDRIKILQVLRNLVGNAVKYSKEGLPIVLRIKQIKDHDGGAYGLEISVTDQGIGIPADELHAVFQPFYESKRTRQKSGGTGLGLSITREIVDAHGGKIRAQSNPVGTTFVFTIPSNIVRRTQLSQDTLRRSLEQLPGHIYLMDASGAFCGANQAQARDLGYSKIQELIGKTSWDILPPEAAKASTAIDSRVFEEEKTIEAEELCQDNQYYLSIKAPVKDADGKIVGLLGNSLNITKLKTREFELLKENAELKKSLEYLEEALHRLDPAALAVVQQLRGAS